MRFNKNTLIRILAFIYLFKNPEFWKLVPRLLFVNLFWEGLGGTIIFILMIPAMRSGDIPIWVAIIISITMGFVGVLLSNTYDRFNPLRGIFGKKNKKDAE